MQDKKPRNENGFAHGYWERYHHNGNLWFKGEFINGKRHGQWEDYFENGNPFLKSEYLKGERIGFCKWYNSDSSIDDICFYCK